jgi:signal transduction histidine kinase
MEDYPLPIIYEEDRSLIAAIIQEALAGSSGNDKPFRIKNKNGPVLWAAISWQPFYNRKGHSLGFRTSVRNIDERIKAEEALRESKKILNDTGKMGRIGGWEHDLRTRTATWTEALYDIIEIPYDQPIPGPDEHLAFYPEKDRQRLSEVYQACVDDHIPFDLEFQVATATGRPMWARVYGEPVLENRDCIKLRGTFQDITERKQIEIEREKLLDALKRKNEELESIVYVSSHDLKSPLINIQGFGGELEKQCQQLNGLLRNAALPKQDKDAVMNILNAGIPQALDFICTSGVKMKSLIDGLLQVSRISRDEIQPVAIDMNVLVEKIYESFAFKGKEHEIVFVLDDLPACCGDPFQIDRVFTNLVGNAIKYLDPIRHGRIHIRGYVEDGNSVYCVEDNGIGIDEEYRTKIFELFHRLDPNREGEGIGLTVVKRIVENHYGEVWLESEAGTGSRFYVRLPATEP